MKMRRVLLAWACVALVGIVYNGMAVHGFDLGLFVADSLLQGIFVMNVTSGQVRQLNFSGMESPYDMDYDSVGRRLYWSDMTGHSVRGAGLDGSNQTYLFYVQNFPPGVTCCSPDGVAVDSKRQLVFFADDINNLIGVIVLGTGAEHIVHNLTDGQPQDVALDTDNTVVYYSQWWVLPRIAMVNYDGGNPRVLVNTSIICPYGLAIDLKGRRLYWADANTHRIEGVGLDGSQRAVVLEERLAIYNYLALFGNTLFFTDFSNSSVVRTVTTDGKRVGTVGPPMFKLALGLATFNLSQDYVFLKNLLP